MSSFVRYQEFFFLGRFEKKKRKWEKLAKVDPKLLRSKKISSHFFLSLSIVLAAQEEEEEERRSLITDSIKSLSSSSSLFMMKKWVLLKGKKKKKERKYLGREKTKNISGLAKFLLLQKSTFGMKNESVFCSRAIWQQLHKKVK